MQENLRCFSRDENNQKWLFVTEEDIKSLPCFQNETLIAIKAPHGTTSEVPDPDEAKLSNFLAEIYRMLNSWISNRIIELMECLAPIHLIVQTEMHQATPGSTGGVRTIGNYAAETVQLLKDGIELITDVDTALSNLLSYPLYATLARILMAVAVGAQEVQGPAHHVVRCNRHYDPDSVLGCQIEYSRLGTKF